MTDRAAAVTVADWESWVGRDYAVVDAGIELAAEPAVETTTLGVDPVALSAADESVATLSESGRTHGHSLPDGSRRTFPNPDGAPAGLCLSGQRLYAAGACGTLTVTDTRLGGRVGTVETALEGPTALAGTDEDVYVLDSGRIDVLRPAGRLQTVVDDIEGARDLAATDDRLLVATADGIRTRTVGDDQPSELPPCPVTPRRVAAGGGRVAATGLDSDGESTLVVTDDDGCWRRWASLPAPADALAAGEGAVTVATDGDCLSLSRTQKYAAGTDGAVVAGQFDAGADGVQWHRLCLDVTVPGPETGIDVSYRAGDDLDRPTGGVDPAAESWTAAGSVEDCLLRSARGRYLQVAVELDGSADASPRVESVWASCPRESLLRYLPELYRTADTAVLERLLAVFGSVFADVDRTVADSARLLDPDSVPASSLGWLAGWLGLDPRPAWPTPARRARVRRAPELARSRGTRDGLRSALDPLLSHLPGETRLFVVEPVDVPEGPASRPLADRLADERSVLVYAGPFETDRGRRLVADAVARETPAHVDATLVPLTATTTLGARSFLGANSQLPPSGLRLDETTVGSGTLSAGEDPTADRPLTTR